MSWAITWGDRTWTTATNGDAPAGAVPVRVAHYAALAALTDTDTWAITDPASAPGVLINWVIVLGVSDGLWADLGAARAEVGATPLDDLADAYTALGGE